MVVSCSCTIGTILLFSILYLGVKSEPSLYKNCGGTWRGENRGVITTPNFPGPYPVPIHCRWIIEAPEDKVIAIYFTQFYMREGLKAVEYAFYSESLYMGKTEFKPVTSDKEPTYLVTNKPVLVLDFAVTDVGNVHMRVREFFLDVFGFNVTFEIIGKNESIRNDPCLYHHCSFTGNCYAAPEHKNYYCSCFQDYFGSECQYDKRCGPSGVNDMCQNGGTCRYYIGSTVRVCECPNGFEGAWCEKEQKETLQSTECALLGCGQTCSKSTSKNATCACNVGFKLAEDQKTCLHTGRTRFLVSFRLYDWNVDLIRFGGQRYKELKKGIETALLALFVPRLHHVENLTVLEFQ